MAKKIIDYTEETKDSIITEQESKGWRLAEDQLHFDGKHLVFEKDLEEEIGKLKTSLTGEVDSLKARVATIEDKEVTK